MKALKKINAIEINLEISVINVKQSKLKMKEIKNKILLTTAKFLLLKQKLKNLLAIHKILKEKLLSRKKIFSESKGLKSKNKFCLLWKNFTDIRDDIIKSREESNMALFKNRSLLINDILLNKSKKKISNLQVHVEKQLNNTFLEQKDNFTECYKYFMINPEITDEKFLDILFMIYNKTIFQIIKCTMIAFTDDQRSSLISDFKKTRDIANLKYEENKFVAGFNQLLKNLSNVGYYYNLILSKLKLSLFEDEV